MPALGSLFPNSDVQKGSWLNTGGTTTGDFFALVDEVVASANDADYIRGPSGAAATTSAQVYDAGLTNTASDFGSMTTLNYNVRYRQFNRSDDTLGFTILIESSGGTALTNTVTFAGVTTTTFTSSGATAFTLTSAGTTATKSDWDGAVLVVSQTYSSSMANDNAYIAISAIELTGTYALTRTASSSGTGSSSTSSIKTAIRTASNSGTGSSVANKLLDARRTASSSGTGSSNNASNFTRPGSYDDVLINSYDDVDTTYDNSVTTVSRTATSSGTGSSVIVSLVTRLRTGSSSGIGSSTSTKVISRSRTASSSGVGFSSANGVLSKLRTASSSGVGSSSVSELRTVPRDASSSGTGSSVAQISGAVTRTATSSGVGSSSIIQLRSVLRTSFADGVGSSSASGTRVVVVGPTSNTGDGSSSALVLVTSIRTASASGVSSSVVVSGKITARTAFSGAYAPEGQALWVNAGKSLMEEVRMPPFWIDKQPRIIRRRF